ncbi:MAG: DUF6879 family protein, partial [Pseudonocardiaceae bacterium]
MKLVSEEEPLNLIATFKREALHLEMRDVYAVKDEAQRFARFLEKGYRDHDAEAEERRPWMRIVQDATAAGKMFRRARIISEPATDYIRYEWEGTGSNVEAGEKIKWLPRRL